MKKRISRMLWAFRGQDDRSSYRLCWLYVYSCCPLARLPGTLSSSPHFLYFIIFLILFYLFLVPVGVMTMESTKRKNLGAFDGVTDRVAWQGIRNQGQKAEGLILT